MCTLLDWSAIIRARESNTQETYKKIFSRDHPGAVPGLFRHLPETSTRSWDNPEKLFMSIGSFSSVISRQTR